MRYVNNSEKARKLHTKGGEWYQGETLMEKLRRKVDNKEKEPALMDTYYTEKSAGVLNALNIRADRFEIGQKRAEEIASYRSKKKAYLLERMKTAEVTEKEGKESEAVNKI